MKTISALIFLFFTLTAFAESDSCQALIEEFKIDPVNRTGEIRNFSLSGKTADQKACVIRFLPDFCAFQLEAPLEKPEMYYLSDTSTSSIRIKFRRGEKFFVKTVTKEDKEGSLGKLTKIVDLEKSPAGYELGYKLLDGRFFKSELKSFTCVITPAR